MTVKRSQLCWDCQNARADRCCWIGRRKAVEGWKARIVPDKNEHLRQLMPYTYAISKCPNFVKDEPTLDKIAYEQILAKELGVRK